MLLRGSGRALFNGPLVGGVTYSTAFSSHNTTFFFSVGALALISMEEQESAGAAEEVDAIIGELEALQEG